MEQEITKIHLGGALGKKFGEVWNLYVSSPSEAIKAININTNGKFGEYLRKQGQSKFYKISIANKKNTLNRMELGNSSGTRDIYIMPAIKGNKSGWGKILAAIVIIIASYYVGGGFSSGGFSSAGFSGSLASAGISLGVSMLIGGIVQLMTPVQDFNANQDATATAGSNIFQGNATAIIQGGVVTVVYGRALVSPMPVSIAFNNFDQSPNFGGNGNTYGNSDNFPGGSYYNYDVVTDPTTGFIFYNQNTVPVPAVPRGY